MKKLVAILGISLVLCTNSLFANAYETTVSKKISSSFNEYFVGAKDVKWYTDDNQTFTAKFTLNSSKVTAYYREDGSLLATSRFLTGSQLPINVLTKLNKKYADCTVYSAVEYSADDVTVFYITMESKDSWITVKADKEGNARTTKKMKKA
ncbi:hypothetical protein DVR12_11515 [Chitinophaga silvatica]|uniref:Beta-lactamase-inhibitor-like PepSY-like domain-containing protein n=1 Tax=Chitinophaga silvatica TaxID=2282649 RepID=A0A3E1Y9T3_9BACT|nr:hypothetical protein [Chitinophaga silvatica]RFS22432.1 hypothetical protein DVR12_11515 [Chitinophaga silvatica]